MFMQAAILFIFSESYYRFPFFILPAVQMQSARTPENNSFILDILLGMISIFKRHAFGASGSVFPLRIRMRS